MAVANPTEEPMIFRSGEKVNNWEDTHWEDPRIRDTPHDLPYSGRQLRSEQKQMKVLMKYLVENRHGRPLPQELQTIEEENNDVFAVDDQELRQTSLVSHDIDTGDAK